MHPLCLGFECVGQHSNSLWAVYGNKTLLLLQQDHQHVTIHGEDATACWRAVVLLCTPQLIALRHESSAAAACLGSVGFPLSRSKKPTGVFVTSSPLWLNERGQVLGAPHGGN